MQDRQLLQGSKFSVALSVSLCFWGQSKTRNAVIGRVLKAGSSPPWLKVAAADSQRVSVLMLSSMALKPNHAVLVHIDCVYELFV